MLLSPFASKVYLRIRTRKTVAIGIFICSMALSLTALPKSPNLPAMFFSYSLMFGVGGSLVLNPPFFLLDAYFPMTHPRHVLTTSLISCAFPLGTLIFNPLTYFFLMKMSYRLVFSMFAIITFTIGCACAIFLVEPDQMIASTPMISDERTGM